MNKVSTSIIALLLSSTISLSFANEDRVVASYKDGEVKESQVIQHFKHVLDMQAETKDKKFADLEQDLKEKLVRGYINSKLLDQEAKNLGIESSSDFQEKLLNIKGEMVRRELIEKHIKSAINDKMIDDEYEKMSNSLKGKDEVKISHILVENEQTAKEIKKKLNKGAKFSALSKEFSKDENSKSNGGEIGYILKGTLVPEFEEKAFLMKVNEISNPVKTQFGWHIIKILDKRPARIPSKDEAHPSIVSKLSKEILEKYIEDLAKKANVQINLK